MSDNDFPATSKIRRMIVRVKSANLQPVGLTLTSETREQLWEEAGGRYIEAGPIVEYMGLPIVGFAIDGVVTQ